LGGHQLWSFAGSSEPIGCPRETVTATDEIIDFVRKNRTIIENSSVAVTISADPPSRSCLAATQSASARPFAAAVDATRYSCERAERRLG